MNLRRSGSGRARARLAVLLAVLPVVAAVPRGARAQSLRDVEGRWALDLGAGIGIPGAVIDEELDPGPAGRVGVAYGLKPHLAVRADVDVARESGRTFTQPTFVNGRSVTSTPDRTLWHVTLGFEAFLAPPREGSWWASAVLSGGITTRTGPPGASGDGPWATAGAGLRVGRQLSRTLGLWLGVRAYGFVVSDPGNATVNVNLPLLAGVRVGL